MAEGATLKNGLRIRSLRIVTSRLPPCLTTMKRLPIIWRLKYARWTRRLDECPPPINILKRLRFYVTLNNRRLSNEILAKFPPRLNLHINFKCNISRKAESQENVGEKNRETKKVKIDRNAKAQLGYSSQVQTHPNNKTTVFEKSHPNFWLHHQKYTPQIHSYSYEIMSGGIFAEIWE